MKRYEKFEPQLPSPVPDHVVTAMSTVYPRELVSRLLQREIALYDLRDITPYGLQIAYIGPENMHPALGLPPVTDQGYRRVVAIFPGDPKENNRKHKIVIPPHLKVEVRQPTTDNRLPPRDDFVLTAGWTQTYHEQERVVPLYTPAVDPHLEASTKQPHILTPQSTLLVVINPHLTEITKPHGAPDFFCSLLTYTTTGPQRA